MSEKAALNPYELLDAADAYLRDGHLRQASQKLWAATNVALDQYAALKNLPNTTYQHHVRNLEELVKETGDEQLQENLVAVNALGVNFYEGFLSEAQIRHVFPIIQKFINVLMTDIGLQDIDGPKDN